MEKIYKLLFWALLVVPAVVCVFIMRLLRPIVLIRLGKITIWRLGCIYQIDWYLSGRSQDVKNKRCFDIFYFVTNSNIVCNWQLIRMWKRVIRVFPFSRFASIVDRIQKWISGGEAHGIPLVSIYQLQTEFISNKISDLKYILTDTKSNIGFTEKEKKIGEVLLREMGIPEGDPIVCFHARDSAFLDFLHPEGSWDYHDYRDSNIRNYIPAMEKLTKQGFCSIRMGSVVKEKLSTNNSAIIDYATNGARTDFLDVYLSSQCKFFVCSDGGISTMPEFFRRPVVYVNWTMIKLISPWVLNGLFIFKKFYLPEKNQFLTFAQAMNLEFGGVDTKDYLAEKGVELIENTPDEIMDVVDEMEQRLNGTWKTTREDEDLQGCFWALFGSNNLKSKDLRIGSKFLRQNKNLLNQGFLPPELGLGKIRESAAK